MSRPTLPQNDLDPSARARALSTQAAEYQWSYEAFEGIACAREVPASEQPPASWTFRLAEILLAVLVNAGEVDAADHVESLGEAGLHRLRGLITDARRGGVHLAFDHLETFVQGQELEHVPAPSLESFDLLYQTIDRPPIAEVYGTDRSFAELRLAGPNPMELRRLSELPEHFPVTEAHFQRALGALYAQGATEGHDRLQQALEDGRLFIADYAGLDGLGGGTYPRQKHIRAPLALFVSTDKERTLLPVAIQCAQAPSESDPIFTPADRWSWRMARATVQVADATMHQGVRHLAHTHLVMEPFRISAKRNLAPAHPLAQLLGPHLEGTLYINEAANTKLMAPNGGVDAVLALPIADSRAAAIQGVKSWDFRGSMLERDLRERGLMDRSVLPVHPYRDDALLHLSALRDWVEGFLRVYYRTAGDVHRDPELRAFFMEVQHADGGRIKGVGQVQTVEDLIDVVTHIVFTASVQHAAVNFPQLPVMSYPPAFPLSAFAPPPSDATATEHDLLRLLPALDLAHYQATLGYMLGSLVHEPLGAYREGWFSSFTHDTRVAECLRGFRHRLGQIEGQIDERNLARASYTVLKPSRVPNSINI